MTTRSAAAAPYAGPLAVEPPLLAAMVTATAGAALLAVAPALTVATAADGASTAPSFTAGPLLAALGVAPVALAWLLAYRGRPGWAAGVLAGLAALAPGRAILDLQLLVAPWRAARPELLVSSSLAPVRPGLAVWALLLGHLVTAVAGLLAVLAVRTLPGGAGASGAAGGAGLPGAAPGAARAGSPALTAALCLGALTAAGLVSAPFRSADPYLLPRGAADAPPLVMLGSLVLAASVVVAACLAAVAAVAADRDAGRGSLLGVAAGVLAVAVPPVLAAGLTPALRVSWGPLAALAGAGGLAVLTRLAGRDRAARTGELSLPALDWLHAAAGALAVLAGLAAVLGAAVHQVSVPAGEPQPVLYPVRLLVPAGLLLAVLGAAVLLGSAVSGRSGLGRSGPGRPGLGRSGLGRPGLGSGGGRRLAAALRPALAVAWASVALAGMAALDAALTATQISGVGAGAGVWSTAVALLAAPAAGCVAAIAGSVERDDVDLSELRAAPTVAAVSVLAAALAVPAFWLPLRAAPGYAEAGLWSNFQVASWGLLAAASAVLAAALVAPWSRPPRAVALLLGAAAVLAVRLAQLPLTGGRAGPAATVAAGTWFTLACLVALLVAALLAGRGWRPAPSTLRAGRGSPQEEA